MCCWLRRAKALNSGLLSQCNLCAPQGFPNSAARQLTGLRQRPGCRLPALRVLACKELPVLPAARPPASAPFFFLLKILPRRKKFAAWMRSRTGRGLGGYTGIFTSSYPDLGSCLSSFSIPGRQPEKKSLSSATGQSCSQRSLCYTRVLFLSDETPLPKPWRTWL